jgi:hypothetical protein
MKNSGSDEIEFKFFGFYGRANGRFAIKVLAGLVVVVLAAAAFYVRH